MVQGRHASVAAARDVEGGKVQRQPHEVVAQRPGDELVDLVAHLPRHAADDGAGCGICILGATEFHRVEEGLDQSEIAVLHADVEAIHRLVQHGVAEPINHMGELGDDGRVKLHVRLHHEHVGERLDLAHELFEYQMLVLHLVGEARGLEQPLAVPGEGVDLGLAGRPGSDVDPQPLVQECEIAVFQQGRLDLFDQAVVLGMEDMVHGSQADVLVAAPVAGDVVGIQQFVVVAGQGRQIARTDRQFGVEVRIGNGSPAEAERVVAVGNLHAAVAVARGSLVSDVVKERVAGANGGGGADGRGGIAFDQPGGRDDLSEAVGAPFELAVFIGCQQWQVGDVGIAKVDSQLFAGLLLDVCPGGQAASRTIEHAPRGHRNQQRLAIVVQYRLPVGIQPRHHFVLAQKHLVGRMRGVRLVLVDKGRGLVDVLAYVVGGAEYAVRSRLVCGAGEHHEVGGRVGIVERVIRLKRNVHGTAAALVHQVEAVVEELAEDRHPGVVGRRYAFIWRNVGDEHQVRCIRVAIMVEGETALGGIGGRHCRRVGGGLVRDQVADGAGCGVHHVATGLFIGSLGGVVGEAGRGAGTIDAEISVDEFGGQHARHELVRRTVVFVSGDQVVPGAVDGSQADRQQRIAHQVVERLAVSMAFGDDDLVEDEGQVLLDQGDHLVFLGAKRPLGGSLEVANGLFSGFNFSSADDVLTQQSGLRVVYEVSSGRSYAAAAPAGGP
ncbi:hypothetical protein D9M72_357460 [compost metagenome]